MINFYNIRSFGEVTEFHNIMPLKNIPSVIQNGILSHKKAEEIRHTSIAMDVIQKRRSKVKVPNGLYLHQYANLYFHARNPMLFLRKSDPICILRIYKSVCDLPNIVFTDQNAAKNYVSFLSINEINVLDFEKIYAQDWTDENEYIYWDKKSKKCAEILIPSLVNFQYIFGAYVKNENDKNTLQELGFDKLITINREMFFLG